MLSEGIASQRGRYGAYLHHDRINHRLRARRGARLAAITSGGAIPTTLCHVVAEPDGAYRTVDEDFASRAWPEKSCCSQTPPGEFPHRRQIVAHHRRRRARRSARNPLLAREAPARTAELSQQLGDLRKEISDRLPRRRSNRRMAQSSHRHRRRYLAAGRMRSRPLRRRAVDPIHDRRPRRISDVPTQTTIIAERFFDEAVACSSSSTPSAPHQQSLGLALRKRFCRGFNFELQAAATDNGLNIALAEQHSFPLADVFQFLHSETMPPILEQAALASPIFQTRWRWDATRALALLRFQGGKKVPPQIQRIRSDDLLASVFPDVAACFENIEGDIKIPDHPLVHEVMKDVLTEALDIEASPKSCAESSRNHSLPCRRHSRAVAILARDSQCKSLRLPRRCALEERRARAVEMRRVLPASVLEEVGALDPAAIAQVQQEAWPDVRDADELHDVLHTLVLCPQALSSRSQLSAREPSRSMGALLRTSAT